MLSECDIEIKKNELKIKMHSINVKYMLNNSCK